jgi:hypothetical protein
MTWSIEPDTDQTKCGVCEPRLLLPFVPPLAAPPPHDQTVGVCYLPPDQTLHVPILRFLIGSCRTCLVNQYQSPRQS